MTDEARGAPRDRPDPQMFWSWVGESIRPVAGWLLAVAGVAALALGYAGVSREVVVAKQIPYLVSGGLLGIGLLFLAGALIGTQDVKGHGVRIARLERLVGDLHRVLLEEAIPHPAEPEPASPPSSNGEPSSRAGRAGRAGKAKTAATSS